MPRKAMVLAAGLGTRLRPLTARRPKPAMPLCGVPPLRFTLARLKAAGVEEVVVNTHWLPEVIEAVVGDPAELGLTVRYSYEPTLLGTGGGLKKVAEHFQDETFYLVNGKLLFDADLEGAVAFHRDHQALATMVLRPYPEGSRYSAIEIDEGGRIRRFVDQFEWAGPLTKCLFTGVHVLEPRVLEYLPPAIEVCINAWAYPRMMAADEVVCGYLQTAGYWAEPSTPARYLAAVEDLLEGKVDLARFREGGADPFAGTTGDSRGSTSTRRRGGRVGAARAAVLRGPGGRARRRLRGGARRGHRGGGGAGGRGGGHPLGGVAGDGHPGRRAPGPDHRPQGPPGACGQRRLGRRAHVPAAAGGAAAGGDPAAGIRRRGSGRGRR